MKLVVVRVFAFFLSLARFVYHKHNVKTKCAAQQQVIHCLHLLHALIHQIPRKNSNHTGFCQLHKCRVAHRRQIGKESYRTGDMDVVVPDGMRQVDEPQAMLLDIQLERNK